MKNTKKLTSLFAAFAMTAQVGISTPLVMAEDAVVEETPAATKLGLIHTFDGVEGDWTVPTGLAETVIPAVSYSEEGVAPNYATFSATGAWNGDKSDETSPYVLADLGDDKIKFEDDKTIVFETRLKFAGLEESTNRIKLGYTLPASDIAKFKLYDKVNANASFDYRSNMGDSNLFEFIDEAGKFTAIRYGVGTYWSSAGKWQASEAEPVDGQWLKVVVHVNPGFVFDYYLYDEDGNKLFEKTAQAMSYVTNSEYFENVALIMTHNNYVASADVDYVKVYNLPTELADNYADYTTSFDEVTLSDVKVDGVLIDEVKEATEGKVTFSADGDVSVANISYTMLTGNKETVTVEDYVYENNTITFPDGLVEKATYTITLDKGNGMKESISFNSPWKDKIGLIYNQEAETNTDWVLGNKITEAEVSSDGYKKYIPTVVNSLDSTLKIPMGDDKIKFVDDKVIVIETKLKATKNTAIDASKNSRLSLVYNAGIDVEDSDNAIAIENNKTKQAYSVGFNHSVLMQLYEGVAASTFDIGYANGSYDGASTYTQTKLAWAGGLKANTLDGNNEYTLIAKLDKNHNSGEIIIEKDGTKIAEKTVADLGWVTASDYLENVAFNSIVNGTASNLDEFSNVIENYNYFQNIINKDNFEVILNGLNRLIFVEISLERDKDDPQRIFESLNSTGLDLSQSDLIRNFILMDLPPEEQNRIFETIWNPIEKNARDIVRLKKEIVEQKYYSIQQCNYSCFLKWHNIDDYMDDIAYYISAGKLYVYKPFVFATIFGEEEYFKDEHFVFLITEKPIEIK